MLKNFVQKCGGIMDKDKVMEKNSAKFVRLDECLDEIYESIECNDNGEEYTIRVLQIE